MTASKLFLGLMIVGPLHLVEQLLTNVEELSLFKHLAASYYASVPWLDDDRATVVLIMIVFTLFSYCIYGVLVGGRQRLAVLAVFGLLGVSEAHHFIEATRELAYDPGLLTAVPYVVLGGLMLRAVWREPRTTER